MDLSGWMRIQATPRPLLVTARGGGGIRVAAERVLRQRGWDLASTPAEADLLVVCGVPDDDALAAAVERVWSAFPAPRARASVHVETDVVSELDRARARLDDVEWQRSDIAARTGAAETARAEEHTGEHDHTGHTTHSTTEPACGHHRSSDPGGGHSMGDHDMGGHDAHMMHGGDVAGLRMADRAPDRDGLALDQLHVSLGPVLPDWPAGLVVRVALQGDVVQSAEVEVIGEAHPDGSSWVGMPAAAAALDSMARLLSVCGWGTAMRSARRLRDELLTGAVDDAELGRFVGRLRRSRTLRWATDDVGRLDLPHSDLAGDATQRWRRWLDVVEGREAGHRRGDHAEVALERLPGLLEGQELAAARVIVASLDPDLDSVLPRDARDRVR
jgi:hypothetical protein